MVLFSCCGIAAPIAVWQYHAINFERGDLCCHRDMSNFVLPAAKRKPPDMDPNRKPSPMTFLIKKMT